MRINPSQSIIKAMALVLLATAPFEAAEANAFTSLWKSVKTALRIGGDDAVEAAGRLAENATTSERALQQVLRNFPPIVQRSAKESQFFLDLTAKAFRGELIETMGRNLEIRDLQEALLMRSGGHALIVGEPGVGKSQLIAGLTHEIIKDGRNLPPQLRNTRVVQLDRSVITSGASVQGNLDAHLTDLREMLTELSADNQERVILVIEDIGEWASLLNGPGTNVQVFLSRIQEIAGSTRVKVVMTATEADLTQTIAQHSLGRSRTHVRVNAPSIDNAYDMVRVHLPEFEREYGVSFPAETITMALRMADRFITDLKLPGSAIHLLERASVFTNLNRTTRPRALIDIENEISVLQRKLGEVTQRRGPKFERDALNIESQLNDLAGRKQYIEQMHTEVGRYSDDLRAVTNDITDLRSQIDRTARDADKIPLQQRMDELIEQAEFLGARVRERSVNLSMGNDVDASALAEVIARSRGTSAEKILEEMGGDAGYLAGLADRFYGRIVGQRHVVTAVLRHLENTKEAVLKGVRGAFLGVGPSQTGKSEFGRALGDIYGQGKVLRIDCGQYKDKTAVNALLGSNPGYIGYGEGGLITNFLKANPDGVIWFDEIEKADPALFDILLSALDPQDPHITTMSTGKLSTRENIFWMTGNLLQGPQDVFTNRALQRGAISLNDIDEDFLRSFTDPQQLTRHLQNVLMEMKDEFGQPVLREELYNRLHGIFKFYQFNTAEMVDLVEVMMKPVIQNFDAVHIGFSLEREVLEALALRSGREMGNSARVYPNIEYFVSSRVNALRNPPAGSSIPKIKEGDLVHVTLKKGAVVDGAGQLEVSDFQDLFEFHVYTYENSERVIRTFAFSETGEIAMRGVLSETREASVVHQVIEQFNWDIERP